LLGLGRVSGFVSAVLGAAVLGVTPARAQSLESTYDLSWARMDGAQTCPTAEQIRNDIASRLSRNPFRQGAPKSFEIVVRRDDERFAGTIYLRDNEQGTSAARELESPGPGCDALVEALSLAVALAIDPNASATPRTPPQPPSPPKPAATVCPVPPAVARHHESAPQLTVQALFSPNLLPKPQLGVAFETALDILPRFRIAAGAWLYPESRTSTRSQELGFGLSAASVDACLLLWRGYPNAALCAGPELGIIHAYVHRPVPVAPGDRVWWALASNLTFEQPVSRGVFIRWGIQAVLPMIRYRFAVTDTAGASFEQPIVAGVGFAGLGVHID